MSSAPSPRSDSLNQDIDKETRTNKATMLLQIMKEFGFYINFKKSAFHPSRRIHYLGFINDSEQFKLFYLKKYFSNIFCNDYIRPGIELETPASLVRCSTTEQSGFDYQPG